MKFSKETPEQSIIIQKHAFAVPRPFAEGHTCTAAEAGVLNQTLGENVRNNLAKTIKALEEKDEFDHTKFQTTINEYLAEYEFGARRSRGPVDPTEREALIIAKGHVRNALREHNYKISDISADDMTRLAHETIEANPDITKEAKRRVDQRGKIGGMAIDVSSVKPKAA